MITELTAEQVARYERDGYLLLEDAFDSPTVEAVRREAIRAQQANAPSRVLEEGGRSVRAVHGGHLTSPVLDRLTRHPVMVGIARQLLGGDIYVYQFKINTKAARVGAHWAWHQDYIFWREEDLLPDTRVLTLSIFLDDVIDENGPLEIIPGSHANGVIGVTPPAPAAAEQGQPSWVSDVAATLKFELSQDAVDPLIERHGVVRQIGKTGSLLLMHANAVHGSRPNLSDKDRFLCLITYSSVDNKPQRWAGARPEFLVSRDYTPVTALAE